MSLDQIPSKEFMRRLGSIDESLKSIAKSLSTMTKIANRQFPQVRIVHDDPVSHVTSLDDEDPFEEEDDDE